MTDPRAEVWTASDGYAIHVTAWPATPPARGQITVLHGIQSHAGWYHSLGRTLGSAGYSAYFPDRRGSGANRVDRGHSPSARRLLLDLVEWLGELRRREPAQKSALAGISWGGKLALLGAAEAPERVDALALICPGLFPQVDVSGAERLRIAWAFFTNRRKPFAIPLNDPALFTASPDAQAFIASDPLTLRVATAGLLAASRFLDRRVRRAAARVQQPSLLILAGHDRIIHNAPTRTFFNTLAVPSRRVIEYPDAHHTLEFEPDPAQYARDLIAWLGELS